jgi:ectoine hydroxylase-related dioxygenase (phytanoyl-CoA dioxygenase family)
MQEEGALSCWMALDDVDVANGCMQFLPGTHLLGRLPPVNLVNPQELASFVPAGALRDLQPRIMAMPAGSCTFHNGLTLHYASANSTDRPRRAMITIYMPDDIHYTGKRHVVTDPLGLTEGAVLEGELFPVLAEG